MRIENYDDWLEYNLHYGAFALDWSDSIARVNRTPVSSLSINDETFMRSWCVHHCLVVMALETLGEQHGN